MRPRTVAGSVRRPLSLRVFLLAGAAWGLGVAGMSAGDEPATAPKATASAKAGHRAIEPAAPVLPAEVVAAMQEGRFGEAEAALGKLAARPRRPGGRGVLRARPGDRPAARRQGRRGAARRSPRRSRPTRRAPGRPRSGSSWPPSSWPPASSPRPRRWPAPRPRRCSPATARTGSPRSTTPSPAACSSPTTRSRPPDPNGAYDLLAQARDLAKGEALRARLLLAMARASQAAGQPRPGHQRLPGVPQGVSQGGRPPRRPVPPGRGPARTPARPCRRG